MNKGPIYELSNVGKRFGEVRAIEVERLCVAKDAKVCLLGPTGAGKSTLLRLLAGVEKPSTGQIMFQGQSLLHVPLSQRRGITLVFQRPMLLKGSVSANIEYGLRLRGTLSSAKDHCLRIMERLGLTRLASRHASTLSGGETQLVALARALVLSPEVLLMDEPTAHLDPAHVALVEQIIDEEQKSRDMTVVWATHNLFQARRVASHVGLLLNGGVIEVAQCQQFFQNPSDPRTKEFIEGKMVY